MGGTIQDWRADLVSDGYGNLDLSPRAKMRMRLERCQFTRPGIAEAVRIVADVDGVRVTSPRPGTAWVLLRMDHERTPGGSDRADRVAAVQAALEQIAPAGFTVLVAADHVEPELRLCDRCGVVLADDWGDVPNRGACQGCAWALHMRDYLGPELSRLVHERLAEEADADPWRVMGEEIAAARGLVYRGSHTDADGRAILRFTVPRPIEYIRLDVTIGTNPEEIPTDGRQDHRESDPNR